MPARAPAAVAGESAGVLAVWPSCPGRAAGQVDLVQRGLESGPAGPFGQPPWVKLTRCKKFPAVYLNFRKIAEILETCKMHRLFSVYRKNVYDLSKCSEKHALYFSVKFIHS
jgi:hypothetical protein